MKSKQEKAEEAERERRFQAWQNSRPQRPSGPEPILQVPTARQILGVGGSVATTLFVGFCFAFVVALISDDAVVGIGALEGIIPFTVAGFIIGATTALMVRFWLKRRYRRLLHRSGWAAYNEELVYWRLSGDQDFSQKQTASSKPMRPSNQLPVPSLRRFKKEARRQRQRKDVREAAGKRFIAEMRLEALACETYFRSAESYTVSPVVLEEVSTIKERVAEVLAHYGLRLLDCCIVAHHVHVEWDAGMTATETFSLAFRIE